MRYPTLFSFFTCKCKQSASSTKFSFLAFFISNPFFCISSVIAFDLHHLLPASLQQSPENAVDLPPLPLHSCSVKLFTGILCLMPFSVSPFFLGCSLKLLASSTRFSAFWSLLILQGSFSQTLILFFS